MKANGDDMGRFSVETEIANNDDLSAVRRGDLDPARVRRKTIQGLVDPGATKMVIPRTLAKELGLAIMDEKIGVRYADGRRSLRSEAEGVHIRLMGRHGIFKAIIEPKRETALIGAIVLEDLDFLVDCKKQCLVPRDPNIVLAEIERRERRAKSE